MNAQASTTMELINNAYKNESRAFCPQCEFLKSRCLCDTIRPIENKVKVVILQHKSETRHALNTTRILVKSLTNISLFIGEDFANNEELNAILKDPKNKCALVFPGDESIVLNAQNKSKLENITHLIMIDGTWRKAKKIYFLSTNLHSLPCIRLIPEKASEYRIRKSPNVDGLSTLEATVLSLQSIEPELDTTSLKNSFKKMIDFQIEKMGEDVYKKNYTDKRLEQH